MAHLDLQDALMMKRVMLLIYQLLHPITVTGLEFEGLESLHHKYLPRLIRGQVKRMLDESTNNDLLFQMLIWFCGYWKEDDETALDTGEEMRQWATWPVRMPEMYKEEVKMIERKWDELRGDDMEVVRKPGERTWKECKHYWQQRQSKSKPRRWPKNEGFRKTYAELGSFVKGRLPKYDWEFGDEYVETEDEAMKAVACSEPEEGEAMKDDAVVNEELGNEKEEYADDGDRDDGESNDDDADGDKEDESESLKMQQNPRRMVRFESWIRYRGFS